MFLHPERFLGILDWLERGVETGQPPESIHDETSLSLTLRDFLLEVERTAQSELPPSDE